MKTQKPVTVELTISEIAIIRTGMMLLKSKLATMDGVDPDFSTILLLSNKLTKALEKAEFTRLTELNRNR